MVRHRWLIPQSQCFGLVVREAAMRSSRTGRWLVAVSRIRAGRGWCRRLGHCRGRPADQSGLASRGRKVVESQTGDSLLVVQLSNVVSVQDSRERSAYIVAGAAGMGYLWRSSESRNRPILVAVGVALGPSHERHCTGVVCRVKHMVLRTTC